MTDKLRLRNVDNQWEVYTMEQGVLSTFETEREANLFINKKIQEKLTPGMTSNMRQVFSFGEGQKAVQSHSGWYRSGG